MANSINLNSTLPAIPGGSQAVTFQGDVTTGNISAYIPNFPVASVAGKTGVVTLVPSDVGADASGAAASVLATSLQKSSNLSDLVSASAARTNLGLATVASSGSYPDLINQPVLAATAAAVSHQFLTAYNATTGAFTLAQPAAADISGLAASATTDTTNAANITSGTLPNARLSAIPNTALANNSVTVTAGSGLGGGGSVALGATVTLTANVQSVAGRTGAVVLTAADIGAGTFPGAMAVASSLTLSGQIFTQPSGGTDTTAQTTQITHSPIYSGATRTAVADIDLVRPSTVAGNYDGYIAFQTRLTGSSLTERMRITQAGNVLIGTSTDDGVNKLQVAGSATFSGAVTHANAVSSFGPANPTGGVEVRFSDNSGNRWAQMGLVRSSGSPYLAYNTYQSAGSSDQWTQNAAQISSLLEVGGSSTNLLRVYGAPSGQTAGTKAAFWGTALFSVNSNGNVLIGTATDNGTDKLQVTGSATFSGGVTASGGLVASAGAYVTNSSLLYFASNNVTAGQYEFRLWPKNGVAQANDLFGFQYQTSPTSGSWINAFYIAANSGNVVFNSLVYISGGLDLTSQTVSGAATFSGAIAFSSGATVTGNVTTQNAVGTGGVLLATAAGVGRWLIRGLNAETGSGNVGYDLSFNSRTDAGGALAVSMTIARGTSNVLIGTSTDNGADKLQVTGTANISSNLTVGGNIYGDTTNANIQLKSASGSSLVFNTTNVTVGSGLIKFIVSSAESARFTGTNFLIGSTTDNTTDKLQVTGSIQCTGVVKVGSGNAPATSSSTGVIGSIAWDTGFLYVCTATNTWKRIALTTF